MPIRETVIDYPGGHLYVKHWDLETKDPKLVLLHGYSFTSDVWAEIGLLERLEDDSIPYLAPDMPYGMRVNRSTRKLGDIEESLSALNALLEWSRARRYGYILVGASLGGYIALEHLARGGQPMGLVLIAPVRTGLEYIRKALSSYKGPTVFVWGTRDTIVDKSEMMEAAKLAGRGKLIIYEGARHPAYLDMPERFINDIESLYHEAVKG